MFKILKLQVLLLFLVVVALGGLAADQLYLRPKAQTALADVVRSQVAGSVGVQARITSFPFVPRVLATGRVPRISVTAVSASLPGFAVSLHELSLVVTDVVIDRSAAFHGEARVQSIGSGSAQASLQPADLVKLLGLPGLDVKVVGSTATVTVVGRGLASIRTEDGKLTLLVAGRSVASVTIPMSSLLPCAPQAQFANGALQLSCAFSQVPPALLRLAQR